MQKSKNKELKELILAYRNQGMKYDEIAKKLNVRPDYARTICSRHNRKTKQDNPDTRPGCCLFCLNPLVFKPKAKKKHFCNDKCRRDFYNRKKMQKMAIVVCENCRKEFVAYGGYKKRFCSTACRYEHKRLVEGENGNR